MAKKRATPPTRKNQSSSTSDAKQDLKSIQQDIKALQQDAKLILKHNREILKKQGKSIRDFRHEFSSLRKLGIISKRKSATKAEPTKYYRSRLRKFADVLRGEAVPIRAPKQVRHKYASKNLYEERGGFLIIPKEHEKQKTRIQKGQVEITKPVGRRTMRQVVLSYNATDMLDLANRMERDPNIPEIPGADMYMFSMYGHNSRQQGFPDKEELVKYIKVHYQHLFNSQFGPSAVKHFKLIRWGGGTGGGIPDISDEKYYSGYKSGRRKINAKGRDSYYNQRQYAVQAAQAKKRRSKMSMQESETYKEKARKRAAASYARKKKDRSDHGF